MIRFIYTKPRDVLSVANDFCESQQKYSPQRLLTPEERSANLELAIKICGKSHGKEIITHEDNFSEDEESIYIEGFGGTTEKFDKNCVSELDKDYSEEGGELILTKKGATDVESV